MPRITLASRWMVATLTDFNTHPAERSGKVCTRRRPHPRLAPAVAAGAVSAQRPYGFVGCHDKAMIEAPGGAAFDHDNEGAAEATPVTPAGIVRCRDVARATGVPALGAGRGAVALSPHASLRRQTTACGGRWCGFGARLCIGPAAQGPLGHLRGPSSHD